MHIVLFLLFGLVVGALARWIYSGDESGGVVISMLIGISGALLGGVGGRVLGWYQPGHPASFVMSFAVALLCVAGYHALMRRQALR